jgi:methanogenic corrinoid protein MtbC1
MSAMPSPTLLCEQWLHDALSAFKQSAPMRGLQKGSDAGSLQQQLLSAACAGNQARCVQLMNALLKHPASTQHQLMSIVLPVVYQIEQDWREDRRDYSTTLFAFWNLQQMLHHHLEHPTPPPSISSRHAGQILITPAPGCQHNLGVHAVADFFRHQGWPTQMLISGQRDAILERIGQQPFEFIGLSVGHDEGLDGLADFLKACRRHSANPGMQIMIGGNIFTLSQSAYAWLGADFVATDPGAAHAFCLARTSPKPH